MSPSDHPDQRDKAVANVPIACVASVSVRFSARSWHFLFFSRAKIGASANHALFCSRPNFPRAKKAKSASNVRKALPKRLLHRLMYSESSILKARITYATSGSRVWPVILHTTKGKLVLDVKSSSLWVFKVFKEHKVLLVK